MNRRGFLQGILAAGMAPAIVKAEILMPVRKIIVPPTLTFRRYVPYGSSVIALDHVIDAQSRIREILLPSDEKTFFLIQPTSGTDFRAIMKGRA